MNMSLGQPYDAAQSTAVAQAWSSGIVIVAAVGNNLINTVVYPAAYTNVIGVSGVNSNKSFAGSGTTTCGGYSNYGSLVDLAAPFEAYSTIGGNSYGTLCGTSMAAPHVTGVAALLKSKNPTWTNQQIVDSLYARAEDLGAVGKDVYFGYGLVRAMRSTPPPPPPFSVTITGTASATAGTTETWYASVTGGSAPYTYQWQYRLASSTTWSNVGTGTNSYTRSLGLLAKPFYLRVTVTSGSATVSDEHSVYVAPGEDPYQMCGDYPC
jgi:subtilisin family serine protease